MKFYSRLCHLVSNHEEKFVFFYVCEMHRYLMEIKPPFGYHYVKDEYFKNSKDKWCDICVEGK